MQTVCGVRCWVVCTEWNMSKFSLKYACLCVLSARECKHRCVWWQTVIFISFSPNCSKAWASFIETAEAIQSQMSSASAQMSKILLITVDQLIRDKRGAKKASTFKYSLTDSLTHNGLSSSLHRFVMMTELDLTLNSQQHAKKCKIWDATIWNT